MVLAVEKILGIRFPGTEYDEIFAGEITAEESESLDRYNRFMKDLGEARNYGRSYNLLDLARRHGLSEEEAREFEKEFHRLDEKYAFNIEGGFEGYEPPPPAIRIRLNASLTTCDLFELADDDMAGEILDLCQPEYQPVLENSGRQTTELAELGECLEELFLISGSNPAR